MVQPGTPLAIDRPTDTLLGSPLFSVVSLCFLFGTAGCFASSADIIEEEVDEPENGCVFRGIDATDRSISLMEIGLRLLFATRQTQPLEQQCR